MDGHQRLGRAEGRDHRCNYQCKNNLSYPYNPRTSVYPPSEAKYIQQKQHHDRPTKAWLLLTDESETRTPGKAVLAGQTPESHKLRKATPFRPLKRPKCFQTAELIMV